MADTDAKDVVILVVGNVQEEKTRVVDCLTKAGTWTKYVTAAGVEILTHTSQARVVNTTPLRNVQDKSATAISRRWISQNSLRTILFGKMVFVVCAVTHALVEEPCNTVLFTNYNCWMDIFGLIFGKNKDIMTLAVVEGNVLNTKLQHRVENCVRRHKLRYKNVFFFNSRTDDAARTLVEVSVRKVCRTFCLRDKMTAVDSGFSTSKPLTCGTPFLMEESSPALKFGPWGPERVFLFGRTGSGKSTLAQMLTLGLLDRNAKKLKASSSIRGGTRQIEHGKGRGWYVVDTPGFGEPEGEGSTIATHEAQHTVKTFVKWEEGTFSHYLFVLKKDRIDELDVALWKFFKLLFGEKICHHFSLVISNADRLWLDENISYLQQNFEGCSSFLSAEFPPNDDDEEIETEYEELRRDSLQMLEEELARLQRSDLHCEFGEHSKMHRLNKRERAYIDAVVAQPTSSSSIDFLDNLGPGFDFKTIEDAIYRLTRIWSRDVINLGRVHSS